MKNEEKGTVPFSSLLADFEEKGTVLFSSLLADFEEKGTVLFSSLLALIEDVFLKSILLNCLFLKL